MKYAKLVVLGLVLGTMLALPIATARAEGIFTVVSLQKNDMEVLELLLHDHEWKRCGRYFASVKTTLGQITFYNYDSSLRKEGGKGKVQARPKMVPTRDIRVTFDPHLVAPRVEWWSDVTEVQVNTEQWHEALPCIMVGIVS